MKRMKLFENIQERLKRKKPEYWTDYRMAAALGITQTHYIYLKNQAKSTKVELLIRLGEIAEKELRMDGGEFWKLVKDSMIAVKQ